MAVGKETIQLANEKISFGGAATLSGAKQLGFDASNRLIYHDGSNIRTIAHTGEIGAGDIVKITSIVTSEILLEANTNETVVFDIPFSADFITYSNGYLVYIDALYTYLMQITNNKSGGSGVAGAFLIKFYTSTGLDNTTLYYDFSSSAIGHTFIKSLYMRLLYRAGDTSPYKRIMTCIGRRRYSSSVAGLDFVMYQSADPPINQGMAFSETSTIPNRVKLTVQWNVSSSELSAYIPRWNVILYALK